MITTRKRHWRTALSGAALLTVLGCSTGQGVDDLPAPATLPAVPTNGAETSPADTPDDGGTAPAAGGRDDAEYTPAELEAALTTVNEKESLAGVILTDAEIRDLIDDSADAPDNLTVTPEECDIFADPDSAEQSLNAALAVMTFAGASSLQPDSISLTSQDSDDVVQDQIEANRTQLAECSEFEMEIDGQPVSAAVTELPSSTDADKTFAVQTVVQVPGTIQETVSLTALTGTTTINVTVGSSGDRRADLDRGQTLVDATVAALRSP